MIMSLGLPKEIQWIPNRIWCHRWYQHLWMLSSWVQGWNIDCVEISRNFGTPCSRSRILPHSARLTRLKPYWHIRFSPGDCQNSQHERTRRFPKHRTLQHAVAGVGLIFSPVTGMGLCLCFGAEHGVDDTEMLSLLAQSEGSSAACSASPGSGVPARTADPSCPKGYPTPYAIMISRDSWGKTARGLFRALVWSHHYTRWSPAFLGMAALLPAHGKWWINPLLCSANAQLLLSLGSCLYPNTWVFSLLLFQFSPGPEWLCGTQWLAGFKPQHISSKQPERKSLGATGTTPTAYKNVWAQWLWNCSATVSLINIIALF